MNVCCRESDKYETLGDNIADTLFLTDWRLMFVPYGMGDATINCKVPLSVPTASCVDVQLSAHKEHLFTLHVSAKTDQRFAFTWKRLHQNSDNVAVVKAARTLQNVKLLRDELRWAIYEGCVLGMFFNCHFKSSF